MKYKFILFSPWLLKSPVIGLVIEHQKGGSMGRSASEIKALHES